MIFESELQFVVFTWPNLCFVSGICKLKSKKPKKIGKKNPSFTSRGQA